jgi:hypothetical protein
VRIREVRFFHLFLLSALGLGNPSQCEAQEGSFAFQIRGGATIPLSTFRDPEGGWGGKTSEGAAFGMGFTLPLPGPLGGYLGFGQYRIGCDREVCSSGKSWVSTGFDVALRMVFGRKRVRPWLQGGLHSARVEGESISDEGVESRASERGAGFEAGGGILFAIGERASLNAGARYGRVDVDFLELGTLGMRYLVVDLGLVLGF